MIKEKRILWALLVSILLTSIFAAGCVISTSPPGSGPTATVSVKTAQVEQSTNANLTMSVIDVGQGDAILLTLPHNESLLIDGGTEAEGSTVVAYLNSVGTTRLNGVVATHPDADHIGGLISVLNSVVVDHVYDVGLSKSSATYTTFLQLIAQKNITYTKSRAGDDIAIDPDTAIFVFNPPQQIPAKGAPDNGDSIVIKVTYNRVSYLLTGDAESSAEAHMMSAFNCSANVLKVGHHGSRYASSASFLAAVKPQIAVISVGVNNTYGHPSPQTLVRLAMVNSTIYRTDMQGTIIVTTNGQTVDVKTARNT